MTVYLAAIHLPTISLYFRRARSAGWKIWTAIYLTLTMPIFSGLLVGTISNCGSVSKGYSFTAKSLAFGYALFFYGGILGLIIYGDPTAIPVLPIAGLLLASLTLIIYGAVHWKDVIAFFTGSNMK